MLARVREALLDDPEDLDLLVRRERDRGIDLHLDVERAVGDEELDVSLQAASNGAEPAADESARTANWASCCAAVTA